MSGHNHYRIYTREEADDYFLNVLEEKLEEMFEGHWQETQYGYYAEDSPSAGAAFGDANIRYIKKGNFLRAMKEPHLQSWSEWKDCDRDDRAGSPEESRPFGAAIKAAVHGWENDTTMRSGQDRIWDFGPYEDLDFKRVDHVKVRIPVEEFLEDQDWQYDFSLEELQEMVAEVADVVAEYQPDAPRNRKNPTPEAPIDRIAADDTGGVRVEVESGNRFDGEWPVVFLNEGYTITRLKSARALCLVPSDRLDEVSQWRE